jgi:hypothetical protein
VQRMATVGAIGRGTLILLPTHQKVFFFSFAATDLLVETEFCNRGIHPQSQWCNEVYDPPSPGLQLGNNIEVQPIEQHAV